MNESKEFEKLSALAEVGDAHAIDEKRSTIAAVRVSPGSYLALASVLTFVSALLLRAEYNAVALGLVMLAWIVIPLLAFSDRVVFDGLTIRRRGPGFVILHAVFGYLRQLAVVDIETIETTAVRTLRRRGSVRYRYRTQISGKGKEFVISSGGQSYRKFIRELFPLVHEDKLDNRSRDLRDYLADPDAVDRKAQLSQLASEDLLDSTKDDYIVGGKQHRHDSSHTASVGDIERAHLLRRLGNELRVAG